MLRKQANKQKSKSNNTKITTYFILNMESEWYKFTESLVAIQLICQQEHGANTHTHTYVHFFSGKCGHIWWEQAK